MTRVILVDNSSYNFYRVTATMAWWQHQKDVDPPSLENKEFIQKLEGQYLSHFEKLTKKLKTSLSEMYLVRDCPRERIWRHKFCEGYKQHRPSSSSVGPFIKHLNDVMSPKFKQVIRADGAESDDAIAILTRLFLEQQKESDCQIVIIANDSDYNQLLVDKRVSIYNPKGWTQVLCDDPAKYLEEKILTGDKSDNVKPIKALARVKGNSKLTEDAFRVAKIQNSQMIDFDYIPRAIQDRVVKQLNLDRKSTPPNFRPMSIQFGLCCLNIELREKRIFCSRKPTISTVETKGLEELLNRCRDNARDLVKMIEWNYQHGIRVFRVSSDIFPHFSNPRVERYSLDCVQDILDEAGRLARRYKQRLTFHPGQYNVVGTPDRDAFEKTCRDLDYQAEVLDRLGCDGDSVMVVHGGGIYGDKSKTIERWVEQFSQLSERVRRRLVLENCEKCFSIEDCLKVSERIRIPVVFDTHHFDCYKKLHPKEMFKDAADYMMAVLETWRRREIKPKFHVSEQGKGRIGHHSDYIEEIPKYLLEIPERYGVDIDIMIEAKMKEKAIARLYKKYPELDPLNDEGVSRDVVEEEILDDDEEEILDDDEEEKSLHEKEEEQIIDEDCC